jgi:quercetin dioxygenase-like cupin family protein
VSSGAARADAPARDPKPYLIKSITQPSSETGRQQAMAKSKRSVKSVRKTVTKPKVSRQRSARQPAARTIVKPEPSKTAPAKLKYIAWSSVELEELKPLLHRQLIVGQNIMVARVLLQKGALVPEHSHHNEQVTYILEGALKFWIDGREIVVKAGEVLTIPPHMPHQAEAIEDTVDLDIFNPPREDWLNKTDQYLRGGK